MEGRHCQDPDVVRRGGEPDAKLDLLDVRQQAPVCQHCCLRRAGRAGGEQQSGLILRGAVDDRHGVAVVIGLSGPVERPELGDLVSETAQLGCEPAGRVLTTGGHEDE